MLRAVYYCGSSVFLPNPNDIDIVYIYDTVEEIREALRKRKHRSTDFNVHYELAVPKVFLGCYAYHYMKRIDGETMPLENFSIFDHKAEYVELLKRFASWLPKENKKWYHILTACYIYKNGNYDLTDTQLKAIQSTHDNGITETRYKFCLKTLNELL